MVTVEIIVVGNEVLLGVVQDTNSGYLCRAVRGMGGRVRHIAVVRDEVGPIAEAVSASLARAPDLIFTCGGLGPTDDDLTLEAVAHALGRRLEFNGEARTFVENRYRELASRGQVASGEMSQSRLKMAHLAEGSRLVENPVGVAPAALLDYRGSKIISLPGVPRELKSIVEGPLQTLLTDAFGRGSYREREITVDYNDESVLAPALRQVSAQHPDVYIKSRASTFDRDLRFRILLSASAPTPEEADRMVDRACGDLARILKGSAADSA